MFGGTFWKEGVKCPPAYCLLQGGRRGGTVLAGYETLLGDVDKVYSSIMANSAGHKS